MAFVLWLVLALVPFLFGKGALALLYGRECRQYSRSDAFLTGLMALLGVTEAAHLSAVFLGWSFTDCVRMWNVTSAVICMAVLLIFLWKRQKKKHLPAGKRGGERERFPKKLPVDNTSYSGTQQILLLVLALSVLLQIILLLTGNAQYRDGDITLETVNSFLSSDAVYQVNPLTGSAYELGVPVRWKLLSLPTLYAVLSKTFGLSTEYVVYRAVPVLVLIAGYLVYGRLAEVLFGNDHTKKSIFLLLVSVLFWLGSYSQAVDGFGVMYGGFLGTTIRNVILVPYTVCMCLKRKWKVVFLCILAEACITWTLYGMGVCLEAGVLMAVIARVLRITGDSREGASWN